MSDTLREAIEAAYDAEQTREETVLEVAEEQPDEETETAPPETETPAVETETVAQETETPETETTDSVDAPPDTQETPDTQAADTSASSKAPAGWRGDAKQEWDKLPPSVQGEVLRREQETNSVLRESAEARRFAEEFDRTIAPFKAYIEADRATPIQAVQNLMQTAAGLRIGSQQQKASIVSEIIRTYGVDLPTLDSILAGETPATASNEQDQFSRMLDERLAPVNQFMQSLEQAKQQSTQRTQQSVQQEIQAFEADPKNVYLEDVREDMAVLLETAAQQGREMSLEQAYNTALHMHPTLRDKVAPRAPVQNPTPTESLQRKKLAAASVPGSRQAPMAPAPADDLRGALEAAWDASQQR